MKAAQDSIQLLLNTDQTFICSFFMDFPQGLFKYEVDNTILEYEVKRTENVFENIMFGEVSWFVVVFCF